MARNKKNKNAFSYNNHDVANRNFINKNFNKTHSYHSNFFSQNSRTRLLLELHLNGVTLLAVFFNPLY